MKKPPAPPPDDFAEMSLDLDILDAITPEGPGKQLVITATDLTGTVTATTTVPDEEPVPEPPPPPGPRRIP